MLLLFKSFSHIDERKCDHEALNGECGQVAYARARTRDRKSGWHGAGDPDKPVLLPKPVD